MIARRLQFVVLAVAVSLAGSRVSPAGDDAAPQPGESGAAAAEAKPAEPSAEEVARRFFTALLTRDEAGIKRYSIPAPGSEILWHGAPINDEVRAAIKQRVAALTFTRLKAGETVTGPSGKSYVIGPQQVNEGRVLLLPEGFKSPFTLVHSDLGWRVKVDWLIATRRAAAEADAQPKEAGEKQ